MQDIVSLGIAVSACEKGAQWQLALHFLQKNRIMQRARDIELRFPQEIGSQPRREMFTFCLLDAVCPKPHAHFADY